MLDAPDRICTVIARTRHKMMQIELREAVNQGAKFLEVRLDFLSKAVDFKRLSPFKACPWLATIRRPHDGGRWAGTEDQRQTILRQAIVSGAFEWVDLEHDIAGKIPRFGSVKRVISYHCMNETPDELEGVYDEMLKLDGDVYKIAVLAKQPSDLGRILAIQRRASKPTIAFCMGELGFVTRFTALKFGAPWIYALFNSERELAPGMPALQDFRIKYPVRSIGPNTKFFCLLGDPVGQSFSPVLHNHSFRRLQQDAFYAPVRLQKDQLPQLLGALSQVPAFGYSVTIPHKEAAFQIAQELDDTTKKIHASNTLVVRKDGGFIATNTDYPAAIESLRAHLNEKAILEGNAPLSFNQLSFLILGAGGAARALVHALHAEGANITLTARTAERANKLAEEVGCKVTEWTGRHNVPTCDVLVNCTPMGMHPNVDESPIHASFLRPGLLVFDTVYNPEHTLLIRDAQSRGCSVVTGVEMFVRQAAMQFQSFTGIEPSLEQMRELMRKAMSPLRQAMQEEAQKSGGFEELPVVAEEPDE